MSSKDLKTKGTGCLASVLIGIPLILVLIIILYMGFSSYNGMVERDESVKSQWAKVESNYQRRLDLVENLVNVVKGYASHEKSTLTEVIEARSKATSVNINSNSLTDNNLEEFQSAQEGLSSALSKLMVVVEQYPDLKATVHFQQLMADLKEIEKQILIERNGYNDIARLFNTYIRTFPKVIFAKWFGFEPYGYFKASKEAQNAPKVIM